MLGVERSQIGCPREPNLILYPNSACCQRLAICCPGAHPQKKGWSRVVKVTSGKDHEMLLKLWQLRYRGGCAEIGHVFVKVSQRKCCHQGQFRIPGACDGLARFVAGLVAGVISLEPGSLLVWVNEQVELRTGTR